MESLSDSESIVHQSVLNLIDALSKHRHGDNTCHLCGKDTTPKIYIGEKRGLTNSLIYKINLNGRLIYMCSQCLTTLRKDRNSHAENARFDNVNYTMDSIDEAEWLVSRIIKRLKTK